MSYWIYEIIFSYSKRIHWHHETFVSLITAVVRIECNALYIALIDMDSSLQTFRIQLHNWLQKFCPLNSQNYLVYTMMWALQRYVYSQRIAKSAEAINQRSVTKHLWIHVHRIIFLQYKPTNHFWSSLINTLNYDDESDISNHIRNQKL